MYLQTFVLTLTDHGIASCVQVSLAEFPNVVHAALNVLDELEIVEL
jgi:hypothetical protein